MRRYPLPDGGTGAPFTLGRSSSSEGRPSWSFRHASRSLMASAKSWASGATATPRPYTVSVGMSARPPSRSTCAVRTMPSSCCSGVVPDTFNTLCMPSTTSPPMDWPPRARRRCILSWPCEHRGGSAPEGRKRGNPVDRRSKVCRLCVARRTVWQGPHML